MLANGICIFASGQRPDLEALTEMKGWLQLVAEAIPSGIARPTDLEEVWQKLLDDGNLLHASCLPAVVMPSMMCVMPAKGNLHLAWLQKAI